ncbi:hypothetical protein DSO57_1031742 [Entomophthora muscae]|uniref:Uncharacterized protein n=1 Tax=Entomophthora muscae TaxID=34485 RepID=A0ACC2SPM9_9FUNG|nr:hypothetical protein DSO57_1031742 [Entomophthora muscae]
MITFDGSLIASWGFELAYKSEWCNQINCSTSTLLFLPGIGIDCPTTSITSSMGPMPGSPPKSIPMGFTNQFGSINLLYFIIKIPLPK